MDAAQYRNLPRMCMTAERELWSHEHRILRAVLLIDVDGHISRHW